MTISNILKANTGKFEQESISTSIHGFNGRYRHWWSHDRILFHSEVEITQSRPALCDPIDYIVHGFLQARILEWVAIPFSRVSS